jgi:hypothetical protein
MMGRNIDFFAVFFIALAMLGFAEARSWHVPEALDSIRVENAIDVQQCPVTVTRRVLANLSSILHL